MTRYALVLIVLAAPTALAQSPGADILKQRCVSCHESDIITSQKLSLTGWTNSINKMVRWGSQITAEERDVLQPYLAAHFSPLRQGYGGQAPKPAASHANTDAGLATYKRACQNCQDADIIEQIKDLLETRVQPAVANDGGSIVYRGYKDGKLYVEMQGACAGCPSSTITLKRGIESLIKHYVPEVETVEAV